MCLQDGSNGCGQSGKPSSQAETLLKAVEKVQAGAEAVERLGVNRQTLEELKTDIEEMTVRDGTTILLCHSNSTAVHTGGGECSARGQDSLRGGSQHLIQCFSGEVFA